MLEKMSLVSLIKRDSSAGFKLNITSKKRIVFITRVVCEDNAFCDDSQNENCTVTSYAYDAVGNLVKAKDENGLITEYVYDALEQAAEISDSYSPWTCSRSSGTGSIPGNDRSRCRSSGCNVPDGECGHEQSGSDGSDIKQL